MLSMRLFKSHITTWILSCIILLAAINPIAAQTKIRVTGSVCNSDNNTSIRDAVILVNEEYKGNYSNIDGQFSIVVPNDATLRFTHPNYSDYSTEVDGRQVIDVKLQERAIEIRGVEVHTTVKPKKITVDQTEIDVRGQYLRISTRYHLPSHLFTTDRRMIAQPVIVDNTADTTYILRPVVIDGNKYNQIQNRWLNFGEMHDPLSAYVVGHAIDNDNSVYTYVDSVFLNLSEDAKLNNDFYSNCYIALVSYHEPPIFLDTVTIARGLINPVRHFTSDLRPMQLDGSILERGEEPYLIPTGVDTIYRPEYELQLQQVNGSANIAFKVNSPIVNYNDAATVAKIEDIRHFLESLQDDPDATIKSISLCGYASPDGLYSKNRELAQGRTDEVMRLILTTINDDIEQYIEIKSDSYVEPWSSVAALLDDTQPALAAKIREFEIKAKGNYDVAGRYVRSLPQYKSLIAPHLAELRTVTYNIDYSVYKPLPYEVIRVMYDNGEALTRSEFYVLISNEPDKSLIPQMEAAALKAYPNYIIFANRAALKTMERNRVDLSILRPIIDERRAPMPLLYNQTIMALQVDSLNMADSIATLIEPTSQNEYLRNVVKVRCGDFAEAYPYFEKEESLNRAVLLLAMQRNKEAMALMDKLMLDQSNNNDAAYCYIYATCGSRLEDLNVAIEYLDRALSLDPSYEDVARCDADMMDIYELVIRQNGLSDE